MTYVDTYTKITNRLIADLEQGVLPWRKPWDADHLETWSGLGLPLRSTGQPYRGINTIMLWWAAATKGYKCRYWFTFDQVKKLGGSVMKGEKAELAVFWKPSEKPEPTEADSEAVRKFLVVRDYSVFNGDQCKGLPDKYFEVEPEPVFDEKAWHAASEEFFAKTGARFKHGGNKALYSVHHDFIQLPPFKTFRTVHGYVATKAHELIHWTRHPSRLDRDYAKQDPENGYAKEELVAEIGAAFLGAHLGIAPYTREDHGAYIGHWLQVMKGDNRAIFNAASKAQQAVDYLRSLQSGEVEVQEREAA